MPTVRRNIVVLGAGIIGLTTAIRLKQAGHTVTVVAKHTPATVQACEDKGARAQLYTSSGSGGFWMPFLLAGDHVQEWATESYIHYTRESEEDGIRFVDAFLLSAKEEPELPWYDELTSAAIVRRTDDARVPDRYVAAVRFKAALVHMEVYLACLEARLTSLRVPIVLTADANKSPADDTMWTLETARQFAADTYADGALLVNCTGIGASKTSDDILVPGRGVTVRIRKPPGKHYVITEDINDGFLSRDGLLAYAIPRGEELYTLGGTVFKGDWSEDSTEEERDGVIDRALTILQVPRHSVHVVSSWTGLRPSTPDGLARVGLQHGAGGDVIANFGHGGSGVTTCWGCAAHVVRLVEEISQTK